MSAVSITKEFLSGSTNGRPVKIVQTATAGTTIHTAHATDKDEITVFLSNSHSADIAVTFEYGGVSSPDDHIKCIVPAGETILAIAGLILSGSLVLRAFAGSANLVMAAGFVNRIHQT